MRHRPDGRPWAPMWDAWSPLQDQRLAEWAGTMDVPDLATALSLEFDIPRTAPAVRIRAKRIGVSLWRKAWSMRDVEHIFDIDHRAIVRWWIQPGLLVGQRWPGRGPYAGWLFTDAAVEDFVRQHSYAYDWRRMQPGHPLRGLAEIVARRDPWVTFEELRTYVVIAEGNLKRWMRRGLVPHQRRYLAGGDGRIMVRAADMASIRERIRAAQAAGLERSRALFTAMRRRQLAA